MKIDILGTEYTLIEADENEDAVLLGKDGYCDTSVKLCVVDRMQVADANAKHDLLGYKKSCIRHELIHAFLYESGLDVCSFGQNEEMVDWIAIQFPKLLRAFRDADAL